MKRALVALTLVAGCAAPLRIVAGGDLHLGPRSGAVLEPLRVQLVADLRLCNLEGPLVDACAPDGESLCAPVEKARAVFALVDVAVLENNHLDDQGARGRASTVRALAAQGVVGADARFSLELHGRRVTLLSRSLAPGALPSPELGDEIAAITNARAGGLVLVSLHWGETGVHLPSPEQRRAARAIIDAGAVAVLGHGPHTVQPVERYRGGVIAYSLGNLAFECDCSMESDSFLLRFEIDRRGAVGEVALLPIEAGVRGGASRPSRDDELLRLLEDLEMALGMKTVRRGEELFVSPTRGDERAIRRRR